MAGRELRKDAPLCPICLHSELKIQEGKMREGQNVCVDCGNLICLNCGSMEQSVTSKVGSLLLFALLLLLLFRLYRTLGLTT